MRKEGGKGRKRTQAFITSSLAWFTWNVYIGVLLGKQELSVHRPRATLRLPLTAVMREVPSFLILSVSGAFLRSQWSPGTSQGHYKWLGEEKGEIPKRPHNFGPRRGHRQRCGLEVSDGQCPVLLRGNVPFGVM